MGKSKQNHLSKVFKMIDPDLSKFYSSRPLPTGKQGICSCKFRTEQRQEQIRFYSCQKQMIAKAGQILTQQQRTTDEKIVGKILYMVVDYINKILQLTDQEFLCQCKKSAISQSVVLKHKLQFMREQNQKFFKLVEQKNAECESLQEKMNLLKVSIEEDMRPITTRKYETSNKENVGLVRQLKSQMKSLTDQLSIKSSKISDIGGQGRGQINSIMQRDHNMYFNLEGSKKGRKSKIFNEYV